MKRISFFLAFVLTLCAFGIANAQTAQISLEQALQNGTPITNDTITIGAAASDIQFLLRVTYDNGGESLVGTSCGFAVLASDPSIGWDTTTAEVTSAWIPNDDTTPGFDFLYQSVEFSSDGDGSDTVAFNFARLFGGGSGGPYDDVGWEINVFGFMPGVSDSALNGEELCLDSVPNFGPSNLNWIWNQTGGTVEINPDWLGPYCFTLYYVPNQPPVIDVCPTTIAGLHCTELTYDFDATDAEGDPFTFEIVSGPGTIDPSNGQWSYNPSLGDVGTAITLEVRANDGAPGPTCSVNIVPENDPPTVNNCPPAVQPTQTGSTRMIDLDADDTCADPEFWTILDDGGTLGSVTVDDTGLVTFTPSDDDAPDTICVVVEVSDGNEASTCEICYAVFAGAPFGVRIEKDEGQTGLGALQGQYTYVDVFLDASQEPLGGFNFLFAYDASALSFASVETDGSVLYGADPDGCEWEYLNYRVGADGNCSGGCPSGLVRVVGIADQNDGPNHPIEDCNKTGLMFSLKFLVSNDRTLECQYAPIRFFWVECGDNTMTNADGTELYIAQTVREYTGIGDPPYGEPLTPPATFPSYQGPVLEDCLVSDKVPVLDAIDFYNGGVDIVCADEIDDRGDINLDGLPYTIADAVMLTNYFIYGMDALPADAPPQYLRQAAIAASDVNADGLTLTVADLVYLIRVVVGDAVPYPKVDPVAARYDVSRDGLVTVEGEMGAAYLVVDANVQPELLADGMEMVSNFRDGQMHIVVWSREGNSFNGSFVNVGSNEISYIEMATADGAPVTSLVGDLVPDNFALAQNYPNPFNPATTIEFSLPVRSDYSLKIYNVTGQLVKEFTGTENAGTHSIVWDASNAASGIYFYKITAGNYTDTKKMVFLK